MFDIFTRDGLISFLYTLPALLLSLSIHEFMHAYVAYKLGDTSQKVMGNLTLHPFKHIDIGGFLCIALFGFGWGKPVFVDDSNFKNRARDNMLVSLAGPMSNLVLAIILTIILKIIIIIGIIPATTTTSVFMTMFLLAIQFNLVFCVFNMLPIPPFDGSKVLFYFLPQRYKGIMYTLERYSFIILLILLFTKIGIYIINPVISVISKLLTWILFL